MRSLESHPFWFDFVDPGKESEEQIVAKIKEWPFMLKNTSLSLGRGIFKTDSPEQLLKILREYKDAKEIQAEIAVQVAPLFEGSDQALCLCRTAPS